LITWAAVPLGTYVHFLVTSGELHRVRGRAIFTSLVTMALLVAGLGIYRFPNRARTQGVVEPDSGKVQEIYAGGNGAVLMVNPEPHPSAGLDPIGQRLRMPYTVEGDTLLVSEDQDLLRQRAENETDIGKWRIQHALHLQDNNPGAAQGAQQQVASLLEVRQMLDEQIGRLTIKSPLSGVLISPDLERRRAAYVKHSDHLAMVADLHDLIIRAAVNNTLAATLSQEGQRHVEIRVEGRPDVLLTGDVVKFALAGSKDLPSPALNYQVGGSFNPAPDDPHGTKTTENFFEVRIGNLKLIQAPPRIQQEFKDSPDVPLLPGQRVVVRFEMPAKPLAWQAWTKLRQVFQQRFQL
jgi:putative peptide zinc metalloprotease protein